MTHATDMVLSLIALLFGLVLAGVGIIDGFLAKLMTSAGVDPNLQVIILVCVAVLLVIAAVRSLGAVFATLAVMLLVLLLLHRVVPGLQAPHFGLPGDSGSGQVHL